jgi:hypothetical protein
MPDESLIDPSERIWRIADGSTYSFSQERFIKDAPKESVVPLYMDTSNPGDPVFADRAYLRLTVLSYIERAGFGHLGDDLKNRLDKIQDIQVGYAPQLTELQKAYASAQILENGEAEAIQGEYKQLLREMQEKIQAVPND